MPHAIVDRNGKRIRFASRNAYGLVRALYFGNVLPPELFFTRREWFSASWWADFAKWQSDARAVVCLPIESIDWPEWSAYD